MEENMNNVSNLLRFRICDEGFGVKNHLIHHMSKTHAKSEMPYLCQICGYRSSMHRDLIDHFQEVKHLYSFNLDNYFKVFSVKFDHLYFMMNQNSV